MSVPKIKLFTIPNFITLLNLLSGCLAIVYAFYGNLTIAALLIFAAGIFDFFDGFAARLLKSYSEVGKQLDSLADVVSFGVAPSIIVYGMYCQYFSLDDPDFTFVNAVFTQKLILTSSFVIALFSALRLAKFNIDERQSDSFIGVPTPANAFVIASLPFIIDKFPKQEIFFQSPTFLLPFTIIMSLLLVSEIPLISLKFKNWSLKENKFRYILLAISLLLLVFLQVAAIPGIFVTYFALSFLGKSQK